MKCYVKFIIFVQFEVMVARSREHGCVQNLLSVLRFVCTCCVFLRLGKRLLLYGMNDEDMFESHGGF